MPQQIRSEIPLDILNPRSRIAIATGNNAAWLCECGSLLIGRSGLVAGVTDRWRIDCGCGRSYFVVPNGQNFRAVKRVIEVARPNGA